MFKSLGLFVVGLLVVGLAAAQEQKEAQDKKERKGTLTGVVTSRGDTWVEVKADGEEKGRRYVPHWRGGAPANGGGPDKEMVATIKKLKVGSRIRLEWEFEERPRVIKVEVLKEAKPKK